jgi:hypothetical protein
MDTLAAAGTKLLRCVKTKLHGATEAVRHCIEEVGLPCRRFLDGKNNIFLSVHENNMAQAFGICNYKFRACALLSIPPTAKADGLPRKANS